jgi:hypothetical protein
LKKKKKLKIEKEKGKKKSGNLDVIMEQVHARKEEKIIHE